MNDNAEQALESMEASIEWLREHGEEDDVDTLHQLNFIKADLKRLEQSLK